MKHVNNSLHILRVLCLCLQRGGILCKMALRARGVSVDKWCHVPQCRGPARLSPRRAPQHPSDSAHCSDQGPVDSVLQQGGTICNCSLPPSPPSGRRRCRLLPVPSPKCLRRRRTADDTGSTKASVLPGSTLYRCGSP